MIDANSDKIEILIVGQFLDILILAAATISTFSGGALGTHKWG